MWRVIALFLLLSLLLGAAGTIAVVRLGTLQTIQSRQVCIAKLQSEFAAAVGDAFGTPPSPNSARDEASAAIAKAAQNLHNAERLCR